MEKPYDIWIADEDPYGEQFDEFDDEDVELYEFDLQESTMCDAQFEGDIAEVVRHGDPAEPHRKPVKLFEVVNAVSPPELFLEEPDEEAERIAREKFNEFTCCGKIARSANFEYATLAIIVFNALYLGYDCDYGARWGKPDDLYSSSLWGFKILDNCFCAFFTFEVAVRFFGYKSKSSSCKDVAFLFDLVLVGFMVLETWVLALLGPIDALKQVSILRLLRLARLLRMGKIMRYFPELQLIVKGLLAAVRSVAAATILLLLVLYVFSIMFTNEYHQGLKADDDDDILEIEQLFGSMGKSLRHLLIMATILDDITACTNAIRATENINMLLLFIICVLISSFTLFNMLLGILCEIVQQTKESEEKTSELLRIHGVLFKLFETIDDDGSGMLKKTQFVDQDGNTNPVLEESFTQVGIDPKDFGKYIQVLFANIHHSGHLSYPEALKIIKKLRFGSVVSVLDFRVMANLFHKRNKEIAGYIESVEQILAEAACFLGQAPEPSKDPMQILKHSKSTPAFTRGSRTSEEGPATLVNVVARPPVKSVTCMARTKQTYEDVPPVTTRLQTLTLRQAAGTRAASRQPPQLGSQNPTPRSVMTEDSSVSRLSRLQEKRLKNKRHMMKSHQQILSGQMFPGSPTKNESYDRG